MNPRLGGLKKGGEGQASKQRPNSRKGNAKAVARYSTRFLAPFSGSFERTSKGGLFLSSRESRDQ